MSRMRVGPLFGIAAIVGAAAAAFAWTSGWIGGRLTAPRFIDAIEANNAQPFPGYRRAHAKGVCVVGSFHANGAAKELSVARIFAQGETPLLGRLSIAGGDPHGGDDGARVRSFAMKLVSDDGQEWRLAMNSFPFFLVATPEAFFEQVDAQRPDPATGKPDPARVAAFAKAHPETRRFQEWAVSAPWTDSWASTRYNGIHAFRLRDAKGDEHFVRWSMRPQAPERLLDADERKAAGAEFLTRDLRERLANGSLRWDFVLSLAEAGDPVDDPSQAWPDSRREVVAGVVELVGATPQTTGDCRDVNFDPNVLPNGIAASGDPVLAARSALYSQSFNRREREIARGEAPDATGQGSP